MQSLIRGDSLNHDMKKGNRQGLVRSEVTCGTCKAEGHNI